MDKFEQHINPSKTIKLKRENGEEDIFTIQPLTYKHLPKLFKLLNKLKDLDSMDEKDTSKFLELFDEETIKLLQELELETMKISYPDEDIKKLEKFVSSNIFTLFESIIEANNFGADTNDLEVKKKLKHLQELEDKKK